MRRKWVLLLGAGAVLLAAGVAVRWWLLRPPEPLFNPARYHRLQKGMSEKEVEAILGCPAGDYLPHGVDETGMEVTALPVERSGSWPEGGEVWPWKRMGRWKEWWGDTYLIMVCFDENGRAVGFWFWKVVPPRDPILPKETTFFNRLADWLNGLRPTARPGPSGRTRPRQGFLGGPATLAFSCRLPGFVSSLLKTF
jgi:hypothetical protein